MQAKQRQSCSIKMLHRRRRRPWLRPWPNCHPPVAQAVQKAHHQRPTKPWLVLCRTCAWTSEQEMAHTASTAVRGGDVADDVADERQPRAWKYPKPTLTLSLPTPNSTSKTPSRATAKRQQTVAPMEQARSAYQQQRPCTARVPSLTTFRAKPKTAKKRSRVADGPLATTSGRRSGRGTWRRLAWAAWTTASRATEGEAGVGAVVGNADAEASVAVGEPWTLHRRDSRFWRLLCRRIREAKRSWWRQRARQLLVAF